MRLIIAWIFIWMTLCPASTNASGIKGATISCRTIGIPNHLVVHVELLIDYPGPLAPTSIQISALDSGTTTNTLVRYNNIPKISFSPATLPSCNVLTFQDEVHVYEDTIILPYASLKWIIFLEIQFSVQSLWWGSGSLSPFLTCKTVIDNFSNVTNHSPVFTSPPDYIHCLMIPKTMYNSAMDIDGDSLAFRLMPAQKFDSINGFIDLYYPAPFTPINFVNSLTPIVFDSSNGDFSYMPYILSHYTMFLVVEEYRNGLLIGSSSRLLTITNLNGPVSSDFGSILQGVEILAYPNPVSDILYFTLGMKLQNVLLSLLDINGVSRWSNKMDFIEGEVNILMPAICAGNYFLVIQAENSRFVIPVVKH
ncbi:MAG: T9SS type A sorting domain-containing protein [Bacteroidetes bacterium]|nr:T9SS type A sorting domain-containing protein [Bacteroidota bacterium]